MAGPASPCSRPFPHASQGRWRTGASKDNLGGSEEVSGQTSTRPTPAQRRALSVGWPGPESPRKLYLTVQQALQDKVRACKSQVKKEEKHPKRLALAPKRDRDSAQAQETYIMNVEKTGGRFSGSGKCSGIPAHHLPTIQKMVESMSQLQEEKGQLQEQLMALQKTIAFRESDEKAMSTQLQVQVESLKEKLLGQIQELNRLRSELGGTDLEKHRDLLMVENERLRQDMKRCESELQELRARPSPCPDCEHSKESAQLREKLAQLQLETEENKGRLAELGLEVQQKTNRLAEVELRLKDSLAEKAEEEERLSRRLRDSQETIATLKAQPQPVKYIIKTVEVDTAKTKQALCESQAQNQYLQEQVGMQRQVLKEMEQQLRSSQQTTTQLKAQIMMYESELERAHGQMLEEMQTMEEDKNRAIEEAFARAQVEMKAVHENLVFQEVQALITSCIDGFNVCIFAYGQTGAGKTYTMEGTIENPGINQRALQLLFSEVQEKASDWEYTITVSVAEIYNEALRDLLGKEPQEKLEIKLCPDGSGQLYVPGLTEFKVQSLDDINKVFEFGHTNRTTEYTNLNEHSSRSHALVIITVRGTDFSTGLRTTGKLNLVDLAGSERVGKSGAEGSRLREAQYINKSLSALGDVISALRSRQGHVPFRNSKLTYLLQDSLSGDSKTLMLVQVSPVEKNTSETLCSLKFAERVRSVELGPGSRRAELMSWSSQEHLEFETGSIQTPSSTRLYSSSGSGAPISRSSSIRRKLQTSGKTKPVPV
ncbi:kinesin-like protein KIFC3 [Gracilinanus agilis]|uniref:kinesin-like protein KIFC3 n=1 Tax=Gracilinanus agilis TaxID=191870 RepID=UPI001CFE8775|nr:kinesin-like protein KIFC3 [Gracilinanus agilis]